MTYAQMTALLPEQDSPAEAAGRGFFASSTSLSDRKKLLEFLLENARYEQLMHIVYCGHINGNIDMKNTGADYLAVTSGKSNLHTRYFSLFMQMIDACEIDKDLLLPMFFRAATAGKKDPLRVWRPSSERVLIRFARDDYDKVWAYLRTRDADFALFAVLMQADRELTLQRLMDLAVSGKGINKVALRKTLRAYKSEVLAYLRPLYATLKTDERVNAVRLLKSMQNDAEAMHFLQQIAQTEPSRSVLALLHASEPKQKETAAAFDRKQIEKFFFEAMVRGTATSYEHFLHRFILPPFDTVADSLFYSVYADGLLQSIVIVEKGRVLDLENQPYDFPACSVVRVMHPVELNAKTEFIRRLNIEQPFDQIRRRVFLPSAEDKRRNGCFGIAGTVIELGAFRNGMRKYGFKALHRDSDGMCGEVGLRRGGILCVLRIAPIDFEGNRNGTVQAQQVRFYAERDVIRLGGQRYVDDIVPLSISSIDARTFSECMYSVYEVMGCK